MITNFVDNTTVITAAWLNKVDRAVSEAIGTGTDSPTTPNNVKTNLGLNNVDNTSDINKPISTATQTALDTKQDTLPTQTGNSGKYLTTNGTSISWGVIDALPSQIGNSGKYLTTNGTISSWETLTGVTLTGTETLTNKTLTTPVINTNLNFSGTSGSIQVGGVDKVIIGSTGIQQGSLDTAIRPIGEGQTWQNLTATRATSTTYTNSTGRPITVVVSPGVAAAGQSVSAVVGGVTVLSASLSGYTVPLTFIVPNDTTYLVAATSGFSSWAELR